jgi:alpha-tubulin suppressor-like RCC1 family protein
MGMYHSCITTANNGSLMCWGNNPYGQLGYGNVYRVGDVDYPYEAGFVNVSGPARLITCGGSHTCALLVDNVSLSCWGLNNAGQLGYNHTNKIGDDENVTSAGFVQWQAQLPTPTVTPSTTATVAPSASRSTSPAPSTSAAATASASVSVTAVPTSLQIVQISSGQAHTCILTNNGSVMCWGKNTDGRLGYANTNTIGDNEHPFTAGFINTGSMPFTQLAAGNYHTCALTINGSVMCWGRNDNGQCGYGHVNNIGDNELPSFAGYVRLPGGVTVVQVVAGAMHTCALASNGSVACWGYNSYGELGFGHMNIIGDNESPSGYVVLGVPVKLLSTVSGAHHTCGLTANGSTFCWGLNGDGQLGYGHTSNIGDNEYPSSAGFVNTGGIAFADLHVGAMHTCGLYTNGSVK